MTLIAGRRVLLGALLCLGAPACPAEPRVPDTQAEARVEGLLQKLTLDEKLALVGGFHDFSIAAVPRLGLPEVRMSDGPLGVRNYGPSTAYPATVGLAATWDADLGREFGASLGRDARARGVDVLLAPAVNIMRVPQNGRNFEYLSEDPYLAAAFARQIVAGIQSQGVAATVKHFAANSQETGRMTIDERIGERALREIYLPAFRAAVERGHAWAVMSAYNRINGTYCTANEWLNLKVLKGEWGFRGVLMSDWGAAHDPLGVASGGLDLEMPSGVAMSARTLKPLLDSGQLALSTLDDKVRRILRLEVENGLLDRARADAAPKDDSRSSAVALRIARESIVLLKNERSALPLNLKRVKTIVVLGPNASGFVQGGGSSSVDPFHFVSILEGLREVAGPKVSVTTVPSAEAFTSDEERQVRSASAVVVCAGFNAALEHEGADRPYDLPAGQAGLIRRAAALNPRTIVVLESGGAVSCSDWLGKVPALVQAWYPGQEGGRALAEILLGVRGPGGKLPLSYGARSEDYAARANYPGPGGKLEYAEGILVGYRWFDTKGVAPLFPFGFGLSYTTFHYGNLHVDPADDGRFAVSFEVTNNGTETGDEISQVYVSPPVSSRVFHAVRELKGFTRVTLVTDQTAKLTVILDRNAFAYFDEATRDWVVEPGSYTVTVGPSSRNLVLAQAVRVP